MTPISTLHAQGNNFMIPYCAKYPEKAMELWNLMYTDADVSTLFVDGIEGKHWVWTDDTHTFVTTPEGVETSASGYPVCDWAMPNQQITPVWEGNPADLWDQLNAFNQEGVASPAIGLYLGQQRADEPGHRLQQRGFPV